MLKQLWTKIKDFWFSFGEQEPDDYFYLKDGAFIPFGKVKPDVELTHREVQQLRSLIGSLIKRESGNILHWKKRQNEVWVKCNPDDPDTTEDFETLCFYNELAKESKADLKKLVNLQTKLKRLKGI